MSLLITLGVFVAVNVTLPFILLPRAKPRATPEVKPWRY